MIRKPCIVPKREFLTSLGIGSSSLLSKTIDEHLQLQRAIQTKEAGKNEDPLIQKWIRVVPLDTTFPHRFFFSLAPPKETTEVLSQMEQFYRSFSEEKDLQIPRGAKFLSCMIKDGECWKRGRVVRRLREKGGNEKLLVKLVDTGAVKEGNVTDCRRLLPAFAKPPPQAVCGFMLMSEKNLTDLLELSTRFEKFLDQSECRDPVWALVKKRKRDPVAEEEEDWEVEDFCRKPSNGPARYLSEEARAKFPSH